MKKKSRRVFPIIAVVCAVCFGSVGSLFAAEISISVPDELDFGSISNPGTHDFSHAFPMEVVANVPYHVEIVLSVLTNGGSTIVPTDLQVITPAGFGLVGAWDGNVPLNFIVNTTLGNRAGVYTGTLTVTAMVGP